LNTRHLQLKIRTVFLNVIKCRVPPITSHTYLDKIRPSWIASDISFSTISACHRSPFYLLSSVILQLSSTVLPSLVALLLSELYLRCVNSMLLLASTFARFAEAAAASTEPLYSRCCPYRDASARVCCQYGQGPRDFGAFLLFLVLWRDFGGFVSKAAFGSHRTVRIC
jgi:hypothetical protein